MKVGVQCLIYFLLMGFVLFSCTSPATEKEKTVVKKPVIRKIEVKEYGAKWEFGDYVKGDLEYHYLETFDEKGYLYQSITVFGYDVESDSNQYLFDTLMYTYKVNNNHVDFYIDGDLTEVEVRKGNRLFVYDVENPSVPLIIREFDSIGNIIKDVAINENELFLREIEIKTKDNLEFAKEGISRWSSYALPSDFNYEVLDFSSLTKHDSALFFVEYNYVIK